MTVHPPTNSARAITRRRVLALVPMVVAGTVMRNLDLARGPSLHHMVLPAKLGSQEAPDIFSLVGMSWPAGAAMPGVQARASLDGSRWGSWVDLSFDPGLAPDTGGSERAGAVSTSPTWTGPAYLVELRAAGPLPPGANLHLVDPGSDPRLPSSSAQAAVGQPGIISRGEWGADESIRRGRPEYSEPLKLAVIHHTATASNYAQSQSAAIVRSIYAFHVNANGWDDIAYNFLIDRYGQIFEGRAGGVSRTVTGAHAQGFNRHTTGIAIIGNYEGGKPPEATAQALRHLLAWRLDQGLVDPTAGTVYTSSGSNRWPAGHAVPLRTISAHRDVGNTSCPGGPLYGALEWMRHTAYHTGLPKMFDAQLSTGVITPDGNGISDRVGVSARLTESLRWTADVLDHSGAALWSVSGTGSAVNASWDGRGAQAGVVTHDTYRFRIRAGGLRTVELGFQVWRWPNGTFFVTDRGHSYILYEGMLRPPSSAEALRTRYGWGEAVHAPHDILNRYPVGPPVGFRNGSVVRASGRFYIISEGRRRPVSQGVLGQLGFTLGAVIETSEHVIAVHPAGDPVRAGEGHPNGVALKGTLGQEARVQGGSVRWFASPAARSSHRIRDVDFAGPADGAILLGVAEGRLGFRDGSLVRAPTGQTFVISGGQRLPISARSFNQMGYKEQNVRDIGPLGLLAHPEGPQL